MGFLENLDLLTVGVAISAIGVLGFVVFFSNKKSITNKTLFFFSTSAIFWNITNYLILNITTPEYSLWNLRFHIFTAVWYCFFLFQLFYVFPKEKIIFPKIYKLLLVPFVIFVSVISLTPLTFIDVAELAPDGSISRTNNGPGIILFGVTVGSLIFGGLFILLKKLRKTIGDQVRRQVQWIILGFTITFSLHIVFNFIFPALYDNTNFIEFGAIYTFPLIALTSYSILKHKLFNIKVTGIALLVFALSIVAFGEVIFARELFLIVYRSSVFVLILIFGILLIRGVMREVSLREQLQEANKAQENLIHFITHQIKGFITKSRNIFAELKEGSFGPISEDVRKISDQGLKINTDAVTTVQTILDAANIKTGKITYEKKPVDLRTLVKEIFERHKPNAEDKGLSYNLEIDENQKFNINSDVRKLTEAFSNLIDNSIEYTPKGEVKVSLIKSDNKIRFSVKDTGIGIAPEDKSKLFTEGGRAKNALEVNVDSTGFGLYIVKNIIEAHNGRVWVESEGEGKGSEFMVELG